MTAAQYLVLAGIVLTVLIPLGLCLRVLFNHDALDDHPHHDDPQAAPHRHHPGDPR